MFKSKMEYLLSPKNIQFLESFSLVHTFYGFDFDGTLAPISKNPANARMSLECEKYLKKLNATSPVAIITGRSVHDISSLLTFSPKYLIGNHGIEGNHTPEELIELKQIIQDHKNFILNQFQKDLITLGIEVEDKTYSLTIHYRNSHSPEIAEKFLISHLSYFPLARVTRGKMVFNIIPENGMNKGHAFLRLQLKENAKFGFYIGDDVTDEDVFVHKSSNILTVRVGYSAESHAKFYIKDQNEIVSVLQILSKEG